MRRGYSKCLALQLPVNSFTVCSEENKNKQKNTTGHFSKIKVKQQSLLDRLLQQIWTFLSCSQHVHTLQVVQAPHKQPHKSRTTGRSSVVKKNPDLSLSAEHAMICYAEGARKSVHAVTDNCWCCKEPGRPKGQTNLTSLQWEKQEPVGLSSSTKCGKLLRNTPGMAKTCSEGEETCLPTLTAAAHSIGFTNNSRSLLISRHLAALGLGEAGPVLPL